MSNINKIKVSGQTYNIQDQNATKTLELTQAEYDALAVKDPNTFYIITDSEGFDLSNYYTKSETSGATQISTALASKADKSEIPSLDGYATETWVEGKGYLTEHQDISGKLDVSAFNTYSGSVNTQLNSKASESDLNALNDTVTAHTANTSIHVTAADKAAWNAKSDFSGSYNDLTDKPTIPTVPTSNTAFTNDAGYITSSALDGYATTGDVQTATNDMATKTWVGNQGYLTEHQSLSNYYTKSETSGATQISTALASKQSTLESGTNIKTINNESILGSGNITIQGGGGGKAVSGGTNISITTGETADTINCTLPFSYEGDNLKTTVSGNSFVDYFHYGQIFGINNKLQGKNSGTGIIEKNTTIIGYSNQSLRMDDSIVIGSSNNLGNTFGRNKNNYIFGFSNTVTPGGTQDNIVNNNFVIGNNNTINKKINNFIFGYGIKPSNNDEFSLGKYNNSVSASTTFGDSGNTLFSVGNGTADNARHNAFEIRQNGDIYITSGGTDIKLQDNLGGGGASYSAGTGIDITNDVISVTGKVDTSAITTSVTSSSTDSQIPSAKAVNDKLGGLSLVKLSQSEYDALTTKDSNTLYVING